MGGLLFLARNFDFSTKMQSECKGHPHGIVVNSVVDS